ncbi:CRISPR-associated protein, Csd1 family [Deinococcus aerius]|uniref:CRISPR-associated protein, Csd1 family n=1 Tax=Deinococcus aerius TaxID=200253 RepID=A0A2I9D0U7_9DEIO|nr:type I-C CRISPR-associated protein Cas8c/Csd1 [Deinococcus aerius]GBF08184.1 CRISPR-associated protein, Csd1 family [Deinococcus aerius]
MLDALVEHAKDEEFSKLLPPTGFYNYSQPIRWVVELGPDGARLSEANLEGLRWSRPYTGRTSGVDPHPLADEASYVLGISRDDKGKTDDRAAEKHASFIALLERMQEAPQIGPELREAIRRVQTAITEGWIEQDARYKEISAKDWVTFELLDGSLQGQRLFQHPDAKAFWVAEAQERIAVRDGDKQVVTGECSVCGLVKPLIGRIPVGVKLISKPGPLHSLNKSAFVSGRSGTDGHNNLCYECADTASRVFNALSGSKEHRRIIVMDKSAGKVQLESLRNQVALFWIDVPKDAKQTASAFDWVSALGSFGNFEGALGDILKPAAQEPDELGDDTGEEAPKPAKRTKGAKKGSDQPKPEARLSQLSRLLNVQGQAQAHVTTIDGTKFALAVFSPNVGRTALREWLYRDLGQVVSHVRDYLNGTTVNNAWGHAGQPHSINALMEAMDTKNANLTRDLIRTAYQGTPPPQELLALAVQRFRTLTVKGQQDKQLAEWERQRHLHALAAALKLALYHWQLETKGDEFMTGLEKLEDNPAYLCGRLLAVLEEAQQVYTYHQGGKRLKTTTAQRSFGTASTAPQGIFPRLVKLATVAHLPRAGKNLNIQMETLIAQIVAQGGYPASLDMQGQGNFGLGYWHQRGDIRANWSEADKKADEQAEANTEGVAE